MISSGLMRPGPSGSCFVGAHLVSAHQLLLTMSPPYAPLLAILFALMLVYHLHLPIIMPGLASHLRQTLLTLMRSTCDMFRHRLHIMLLGHLTLIMQTLHLMPFRREMKLQAVWRSCGITSAGTEEGIVNEMLKYGGPAILDMLAELVEALWTTEMVPGHWRAGDIVNIFKKGD